jgi:hypothetical protein
VLLIVGVSSVLLDFLCCVYCLVLHKMEYRWRLFDCIMKIKILFRLTAAILYLVLGKYIFVWV